MERIRDTMDRPVTLDYLQQRLAEGWTLKAIEWEKEDVAAARAKKSPPTEEAEDAPYGLEIAQDIAELRRNPEEFNVLLTILEMIVVEKGVSFIAEELNSRGYRTRRGTRWTSSAIFNLLPRVIEMGPQLLQSADWEARRAQLRAKQPTRAESA